MVGKFESCWREIRFLSELDKFFGTVRSVPNITYIIIYKMLIYSSIEVHLINFP